MQSKKQHFCTCGDRKCPHNPNNPDTDLCCCDGCITKNLERGEIPSCFFKKIDTDLSSLTEFTIESFVKFWHEHNK